MNKLVLLVVALLVCSAFALRNKVQARQSIMDPKCEEKRDKCLKGCNAGCRVTTMMCHTNCWLDYEQCTSVVY